MAAARQSTSDFKWDNASVKMFGGALGKVRQRADGAITATDATLTSAGASFVAADAGKTVVVEGAGVAGAPLVTTIASWTSATEVELTDAASTTVAAAVFAYGTDETALIQSAMDTAASAGVALHVAFGRYWATNLVIPSGLTMYGDGSGSIIEQLPGSAVADTPFISATDASNLDLSGFAIDGKKAWRPGVTGAAGLWLETVSGVRLNAMEIRNTSGDGVGGIEWTSVEFASIRASNWGTSNDYAGIYLRPGGAAASSNIHIHGCDLDGSLSGSCIKLQATPTAPLSRARTIGNNIIVGRPLFGALAIEYWSGMVGNSITDSVVANNTIDCSAPIPDTYTLGEFRNTWGVSISQGERIAVTGNAIRNCDAYCIELIGSRLTCTGNVGYNSGRIMVIANENTIVTQTDNLIANNFLQLTAPQADESFPKAGIHVYAQSAAGHKRITIANNHIVVNEHQPGIWVQGNGAGTLIERVLLRGNSILGNGGEVAGAPAAGIYVADHSFSEVRLCLAEGNFIDGFQYGIWPSGEDHRVLNNVFGTNSLANYNTGVIDASTMIVDVNNSEGISLAPQSLRIRGTPNPTIDSLGRIYLNRTFDNSVLATAEDLVDTPPNVFTLNRVNFGTEGLSPNLGGCFVSINSRWDGGGNWVKTTNSAYTRAMFVKFGAGNFSILFGNAANSLTDGPGEAWFQVIDDAGGEGQVIRAHKPMQMGPTSTPGAYIMTTVTGSPEGVTAANPGSIVQSTNGKLYVKTTGFGNTGWLEVRLGAKVDLTNQNEVTLPGIAADRILLKHGTEDRVAQAGALAASTPMVATAGSLPGTGPILLGNANHVSLSTTPGNYLYWDGSVVQGADLQTLLTQIGNRLDALEVHTHSFSMTPTGTVANGGDPSHAHGWTGDPGGGTTEGPDL